MLSLCIFVDLHVAVNSIKPLTFSIEKQEWVWFRLYCCQTKKVFRTAVYIYIYIYLYGIHIYVCTYLGSRVNCPILSDFNQIWSFWTDFHKSSQSQISRKSVQWETRWYMRTDWYRQTDGWTDMQTDGPTNRQASRQMDRQAGRRTESQANGSTDRQTSMTKLVGAFRYWRKPSWKWKRTHETEPHDSAHTTH